MAQFKQLQPEPRREMPIGEGPLIGDPRPRRPVTGAELERAAKIRRDREHDGICIKVLDPVTNETFDHYADFYPPSHQKHVICKSPFAKSDEFPRKCLIVREED